MLTAKTLFRIGCFRSLVKRTAATQTPDISQFKIEGLCSPPVTPFNKDGSVNLSLTDAYIDHLVDFNLPNVFLLGTTGEHLNLSVPERKAIAEDWVTKAKGRLSKIIVHIGAGNLVDSKELASHAEDIGAHAIACIGPTFFKPDTFDCYVSYMAEVSQAAPSTPFILYDFQGMTGINYNVADFFRAARTRLPLLAGVKHTTPDFASIDNVRDENPATNVLLGTDDLYLPGLSLGVTGNIVQSYMGNVLNRMRAAMLSGDLGEARTHQNRALKVCNIRRKYGLSIPGATRQLLLAALPGLPVGSPRLPLAPVTPALVEAARADLDHIGFFTWGFEK